MQQTQQGNTLDLLFPSHPDLLDKVYVVPGISDHDAVFCDINFRTKPHANPKRNVYLYKKADMKGLRLRLQEHFV